MYNKEQRQEWWNSLTSDQQEAQIHKWQAQKVERHKNRPEKKFSEKQLRLYPWYVDGVNKTNRAQWLRTIKRKNPWMSCLYG